MDNVMITKIRAYYKKGLSLRAIARVCRVSAETIRTMLGNDVRRRPRLNISRGELLAMLKSGKTVRDIADGLNVTTAAIYYNMKKHGIRIA